MRTHLPLRLVLGTVVAANVHWASAQIPADPYSQSRTVSFGYRSDGLLQSKTIEPDNLQSCVTTTYGYVDADGNTYGNITLVTASNCVGATGRALFASRMGSTLHAAVASQSVKLADGSTVTVAIPAGQFPTAATNALNQSETREFDPRFGAVTKLTGPNNLVTRWEFDDLGRTTKELRADGTSTVSFYCYLGGSGLDTSSNTPGCPAPSAGNEVPADAVFFVHTESKDTAGNKMGPFTRAYVDRRSRTIRTVTEAFDGAAQPVGPGALIAQDTSYSPYGARVLSTEPYFLATGSSATSGAGNHGMKRIDVDVLGRPTDLYVADPRGSQANVAFGNNGSRGSRQAAKTHLDYNGLTTTVTNDKNQATIEERNAHGQTVRITDATGAQLAHQHDAFGNLLATKDALQNLIQISYDLRGNKLSLNDPDAGVIGYCYDALGQLKAQQNPKMRGNNTLSPCPDNTGSATTAVAVTGWTTLASDVLGRMTQRIEPEYTSTWSHDRYADGSTCNKGIGALCEASTNNGFNRKLVYDDFGRPINSRTTITSGPSFASAASYNPTTGRVESQTYPTGLKVNYNYTPKGFVSALTLATAATVGTSPPPPAGLLAAYNFDEGAGSTLADLSGNGNAGTLTNGPIWTTAGKDGGALDFDGVNDFVSLGDLNAIDTATALSACAWVKHRSISDDDVILHKYGGSDDGFIFFRDDVGVGGNDLYSIYIANSAGAGSVRLEGPAGMSVTNTWTHVCFTFQAGSATGLRLYVNGVEVPNSPASTAAIGGIDSGAAVLALGAKGTGGSHFNGQIDNVRIHTRVLSAAEIQTDMATPVQTPPPASGTTLPAGTVLWQAQAVNAWGRSEQQAYGNGVIGKAAFDALTGRATGVTAGAGTATNVLNHAYTWDSLSNLIGRDDANGDGNTGAVTEVFVHDALKRLEKYTVNAPAIPNLSRTVTLHYNALGALLYKSDLGNYTYGPSGPGATRPHAVNSVSGAATTSYSYDLNGNVTSATAGQYRNISYTSFNLPDGGDGVRGPGDSPKYRWSYDDTHGRIQETRYITGGTMAGTRTTWYVHPDNANGLHFENEVNSPTTPSPTNPAVTSNRHFLSAGGINVGVLVSQGSVPTLASTQTVPPTISSIALVKVEYWHKDHLRSLATTTDHTGAVTARYAHDPFGKRRYADGNYDAFGNLVVTWRNTTNSGTARGFTGHEHLDDVGLVHANGRLYDAALGRFVSVDPIIGDPYRLQSYDRYAYVHNRPLTLTDPTGLDPGIAPPDWRDDPVTVYGRFSRGMTAIPYNGVVGGGSAGRPRPGGGSAMRPGGTGPFFALHAAPGSDAQLAFERAILALLDSLEGAGDGLSEMIKAAAANGSLYGIILNAVLSLSDSGDGKKASDALGTDGADSAAGGVAPPPPDGGDNDDNNNKKKDSGKQQDRMLTKKEIKEVEKGLGEDIHDIKGGTNASKYDLYKRADGEVVMKPKGGAGPGEPIGFKFPTGG